MSPIQTLLHKLRVLWGLAKGLYRGQHRPLLEVETVEYIPHSVVFLNDKVATSILVVCHSYEYHYYDGRCYVPSGKYRGFLLTFRDLNMPHLGDLLPVVYPAAFITEYLIEHYTLYITSHTRPGVR